MHLKVDVLNKKILRLRTRDQPFSDACYFERIDVVRVCRIGSSSEKYKFDVSLTATEVEDSKRIVGRVCSTPEGGGTIFLVLNPFAEPQGPCCVGLKW